MAVMESNNKLKK